MTELPNEDGTLANHLSQLSATADDVVKFLSRPHDGSEIHPEALAKSEHLATSLKDVIHALTRNEHLAMTSDDVWKALGAKHRGDDDGAMT